MEDAGAVKRGMFRYFMGVARRVGAEILDGRPGVAVSDRVLYRLGNALVYAPLRNVLGMSRIRVAYTAGAAIGPDLFRFYRSIGVNLKQLYGSTETCAYVCLQPDGEIKFDSVGQAGARRRGEDRRRRRGAGPRARCCSRSTTSDPTPPPKRSTREGYFHTGDAGFFDEDGHLKIIDRAKDVGKLAYGAVFAPNYIENKLKFFSYIKEAVAFGHDHDEVCAFINIDIDGGRRLGRAARHRLLGLPRPRGASREVYELIRDCIEQANAELARDRGLAHSQVRRFLILHKELDPDDDELTRTRKVRRGFIQEKYAVLVDALYAGKRDPVHRDAGEVRGRAHGHVLRGPEDPATRRPLRPSAATRSGLKP